MLLDVAGVLVAFAASGMARYVVQTSNSKWSCRIVEETCQPACDAFNVPLRPNPASYPLMVLHSLCLPAVGLGTGSQDVDNGHYCRRREEDPV
jgi:hypothetical protein